jgi:hypothetical protein
MGTILLGPICPVGALSIRPTMTSLCSVSQSICACGNFKGQLLLHPEGLLNCGPVALLNHLRKCSKENPGRNTSNFQKGNIKILSRRLRSRVLANEGKETRFWRASESKGGHY